MNLPPITAMSELDLSGKRVLIRADLNVPLSGGLVSSDTRIRASMPTILRAVEQGASVEARAGGLEPERRTGLRPRSARG